jgi:hypothetical protein
MLDPRPRVEGESEKSATRRPGRARPDFQDASQPDFQSTSTSKISRHQGSLRSPLETRGLQRGSDSKSRSAKQPKDPTTSRVTEPTPWCQAPRGQDSVPTIVGPNEHGTEPNTDKRQQPKQQSLRIGSSCTSHPDAFGQCPLEPNLWLLRAPTEQTRAGLAPG